MPVSETSDAAGRWNHAYERGAGSRSWFQTEALPSLAMLDTVGASSDESVIDVGGGSSPLVDALIRRGHTDVTVLDVSSEGMRAAQQRLGRDAERARWLHADLLSWEPDRAWQIWHDRAVLHFFVTRHAQREYLRALEAATAVGSIAIIATFAPDGPSECSGLPVARYNDSDLAVLFGRRWQLLTATREEHATPAGAIQPFTWAAFRRQS